MSMNAQPLPLRTTNYWILPREHHNCSNGPPQTFPHRVKSPRSRHEIPPNHFLELKSHKSPPWKTPSLRNIIQTLSSAQVSTVSLPSKGGHLLGCFFSVNLCDGCCAVLLCDIPRLPNARIPFPTEL